MIELMILAVFFLALGFGGWAIDHRERLDKINRARMRCKAREPRLKEREDYWAA